MSEEIKADHSVQVAVWALSICSCYESMPDKEKGSDAEE